MRDDFLTAAQMGMDLPIYSISGGKPDSPTVVVYPLPQDRVVIHLRYDNRWQDVELTRADAAVIGGLLEYFGW